MPQAAAREVRRPLVARLALVLIGCAGAFFLVEVGFRVLEGARMARAGEIWAVHDEAIGWLGNPRYGDHNELGLHDRPLEPKGDRRRLLFLGDSVLYYGDGVDDTLPARLEAELDPAGSVDVVDAGVKGYTNWQELRFLELHGLALEPDLVGVAFVLNDCYRMLHRFRVEDGRIAGEAYEFTDEAVASESLPRRVLRASRFLVWLRHRFAAVEAVPPGGFAFDHRPDFRAAWRDEPWADVEAQLRAMVELGAREGFPVFVVAVPFGDQYRPEYLERDRAYVLKPQRTLAAICGRLGIPFLDLYEGLDPERDLEADAIHLTAEGRARGAALVAAFLRERGLVAPR